MKITFSKDALADGCDVLQMLLHRLADFQVKATYHLPPTRGMVICEGQIVWVNDDGLVLSVVNALSGEEEERDISFENLVEIQIQ